MPLLFVYGSLKEGFPNFHVNKGRRRPGDYRTAGPHPFYLVRGQLPCLLPATGDGLAVQGQLFEVTPDELEAMDRLERVGEPGGYQRAEIEVQAVDDSSQAVSPVLRAFVYLQDPALLAQPGPHIGPIAEYTEEHAQRLSW
jgi:gamma-glutamylaminecyclotransferase